MTEIEGDLVRGRSTESAAAEMQANAIVGFPIAAHVLSEVFLFREHLFVTELSKCLDV